MIAPISSVVSVGHEHLSGRTHIALHRQSTVTFESEIFDERCTAAITKRDISLWNISMNLHQEVLYTESITSAVAATPQGNLITQDVANR